MSAFTGSLTLTELELDWQLWRLEQALVYEVGNLGSGNIVTVPVGFETDGASVPRPLWWLLPAWGRYSRAAVVHDFLCRSLDQGHPDPQATTRKRADAIFYEAMKVCGVNPTVRFVMWAAVRIYAITARKK